MTTPPTSPTPTPPRAAVEIFGPWLLNKGDDLMLHAVAQRLENQFALGVTSYLGMDQLPERPRLRFIRWKPTADEIGSAWRGGTTQEKLAVLRRLAGVVLRPGPVLRAMGKIDAGDLVALLDCSGFAYGDQWAPHRLVERIEYYRTLRQRGLKLVMLPQALGPFEKPEVREQAEVLLGLFDLIYARDAVSGEHVRSLGIAEEKLGVCPDITHLLTGTPPADAQAWTSRVCIVPNSRMLDRTAVEVSQGYIDFMLQSIRAVQARGLEPWLVQHEINDDVLINRIQEKLEAPIPVFNEDALATKGVLGACYANIGSRYHSLVSSLSQGTPSIGTSWSHKYDVLFEEYGCLDWLISPGEAGDEIDRRLAEFLEPQRHAALRQQVSEGADRQKAKVEAMWNRIEAELRAR